MDDRFMTVDEAMADLDQPPLHNRNPQDEERTCAPLPLSFFDDLAEAPPKRSIIKGVVNWGETSSWVGPPGASKSALLTDLSVHAASRTDWRGYRAKEQCGVVYFALERAHLVKRRLAAYRQKWGVTSLPIAVCGRIINAMDPSCVEVIVATMRQAEERFQLPVGLAVFDTTAKAITSGGGDEDKAKDFGRVLAHLRLAQEKTDAHFALIGHTGKDETRGARGSNSQLGDVDLMVQISGALAKTATIVKANDQAEGLLTDYRLETHRFGLDEDGDPIETAIVAAEEFPSSEMSRAAERNAAYTGSKLSKSKARALELLADALNEAGRDPPASERIPPNVKVVAEDTWREYCYRGGISGGDSPDAKQKAFKRAATDLVDMKKVGLWDGWVWLA